MQSVNSIMVLMLIPVFEKYIYPFLKLLRVPQRPLQRMGAGTLGIWAPLRCVSRVFQACSFVPPPLSCRPLCSRSSIQPMSSPLLRGLTWPMFVKSPLFVLLIDPRFARSMSETRRLT